MNKHHILFHTLEILLMTLGLTACGGDNEETPQTPNQSITIRIGTATVEGRNAATLSGTISAPNGTKIDACGFLYATESSLQEDESINVPLDPDNLNSTCTVQITGLQPNTHYYYCLYARIGSNTHRSETGEFDTESDGVPTFSEVTYTDVTSVSATLQCELLDNGGHELTAQGFCYKLVEEGDTEAPNLDDMFLEVEPNSPELTASLQDLQPDQTYRIRAFGVNSLGTGYGPVSTCQTQPSETPAIEKPAVETLTVDVVTETTARLNALIVQDGGSPILVKGFYWGTSSNPAQDGQQVVSEEEGDTFTYELNGLTPGTTYYACAFAENAEGIGYGEVLSFETQQQPEATTPTIGTTTASDLTETSATLTAVILSNGGQPIIEKGFCYSNDNAEPTTTDGKVTSTADDNDIIAQLNGLTPDTRYYVRAYANNGTYTGYGETTVIVTASSSNEPDIDDNPSPDRD